MNQREVGKSADTVEVEGGGRYVLLMGNITLGYSIYSRSKCLGNTNWIALLYYYKFLEAVGDGKIS